MVNYKGILISTVGLGIIVGSLSTVLSLTNTIMLAITALLSKDHTFRTWSKCFRQGTASFSLIIKQRFLSLLHHQGAAS